MGQGRPSGLLGNVAIRAGRNSAFSSNSKIVSAATCKEIHLAFPWMMDRNLYSDFHQRFKMNYPVVMGNAKTGELYGGVLGLPIAFLIGRDGRITAKRVGTTDTSIFLKGKSQPSGVK